MVSERTRAGILAACVALAAPAAAAAQDPGTLAEQRFWRGRELYSAARYAPALEEFRASLSLRLSPNSRLYVARCLRELGRLDEALIEYEVTAREADARAADDPRYRGTLEAARAEAAAIDPHVGRLRVEAPDAPAGARFRVGERELPSAALGLTIPQMPGSVAVTGEAPGFATVRHAVEVTAGRETAVTLRFGPPAAPSAPATPRAVAPPPAMPRGPGWSAPHTDAPSGGGAGRAAAWTALGLGAAGLASFAIAGVWADQQHRALVRECVDAPCTQERYESLSGAGLALQTVTNVSLAVGAAGAVAGAVLWLVTRHDPRPPARAAVSAGGAFLLTGQF